MAGSEVHVLGPITEGSCRRRVFRRVTCHTAALIVVSAAIGSAEPGRAIPPPFEPVRAEATDAAVLVEVWGRRYRFDAGPMPASVRSQDRELLAGPARILLDGKAISWSRPTIADARPDAVKLETRGTRGPLQLSADVQIEFDGMIRVDLSISGIGKVSSLRYELPLHADHAELFNHHMVYDYRLQNVDKGNSLKAAGTIQRGRSRFAFTPSFWLGDRDVGIEWWSETNAHWEGPRVRRPIIVESGTDRVVFAIEPVSGNHMITEDEPWQDRFALFPMPMRPLRPDWRSVRFVSQGISTPDYELDVGTRLAWVAFGRNFEAMWHGLPKSRQNPAQQRLRERLADRGIAYIPYGKLTLAPTMHPKTLARFEDWSADGRWFRVPPGDVARAIEASGIPYERGQPYGYAVCMGRKDYLDWILAENLDAFTAENLDGLYFDLGAISRMCRRSPQLGGRADREIWEYFNVRDFYLRIFTAMKQKNPDSLLVLHTVGQPRALTGYADYHWVGEHLNSIFSGGMSGAEMAANPSVYRPDYLGLPEGYLAALMQPHVGGAWVMLPQVKQAGPERATAYHRGMQAWALLNDVPIVIGNTDMKEAEAIARAVDRFGSLADAELHPWWSAAERVRAPAPLRATLYRIGSRGLLVIANLGGQAAGGTLALDRPALGLPEASRWRNLETMARGQPLEEGAFTVHVPARDFRLYLVE